MIVEEVIRFLGKDWDKMNSMLAEYLSTDVTLLGKINRSILERGGKKLRPMLAILIARACAEGSLPQESINYAVASELLHNATLLHDDVADESNERRGEPTIYSQFGPTASVLIGDFWLAQSAMCFFGAKAYDERLAGLMTKTLRNLAEGEMLQLQKSQSVDTSLDDYMRIIFSKTASLFETTCVSAAISVGAGEATINAIRDYAVNLGLAFQIRDDILDYSGDASLGKPVGIDLKEKKITLPLIGSLCKVDEETNRMVRRMVAEIDEKPENIEKIREFVKEKDGIGYAKARLDEIVSKAIESLDVLPESQEKSYLKELAKFTADRSK